MRGGFPWVGLLGLSLWFSPVDYYTRVLEYSTLQVGGGGKIVHWDK